MTEAVLRFDRFELQVSRRRLLRDGEVVPLRSRAFDLLVVLVERGGRLVTKDELLDLVWPGLVVEESNVPAQVAALRKALDNDLIVTIPGRGYRFTRVPQAGTAPVSTSTPTLVSMPAPPRLFGRDEVLARLRARLREPGCLTLVGPSGVGKTALAQALRAGWAGPHEAGASAPASSLWLDLAALSDGTQLLPALGRFLDLEIPETDAQPALARAMGETPRLFVIDNAEHLIEAVAQLVPRLLDAAPNLRLLVTSQLPLAIAGEAVERIEPLALAAEDATEAVALQTAAVAMFVDRVFATDPRYRLAADALPLVRAICADLDGLPLALEMAAARVPLLGLQNVRSALAERFAMLRHVQRDKPTRHRTLLASLEWSHDLLATEEQRLFRALGVFAGGFTVELVVGVVCNETDDRWDMIDRIAILVDRSLVVGNHEDPPRYALLETMRSFAQAKLVASGEDRAMRARHAAALCDLLRRVQGVARDESAHVLHRQGIAEMDNVREALSWARREAPATAVTLAVQATMLATFTPWRRDAVDWLASCEMLLDRVDSSLQALWWQHFATQMLFRGSPRAVEAGQQAVRMNRAVGDEEGLFWSLVALTRSTLALTSHVDVGAWTDEIESVARRRLDWPPRALSAALGTLALASDARGDYQRSLQLRFEELQVAERAGLADSVDGCITNIAEALAHLGRYDEALASLCARLAEVQGKDTFNVAFLHVSAVDMLLRAGRAADALAKAEATLAICRRHGMPEMSDFAALIAAQDGRLRTAALLLGHARRTYAACGGQVLDSSDCAYVRALTLLRGALDIQTLERWVAQGEAMDEKAADRLLFARDDADGLRSI